MGFGIWDMGFGMWDLSVIRPPNAILSVEGSFSLVVNRFFACGSE